jgi:hypothetical protein
MQNWPCRRTDLGLAANVPIPSYYHHSASDNDYHAAQQYTLPGLAMLTTTRRENAGAKLEEVVAYLPPEPSIS